MKKGIFTAMLLALFSMNIFAQEINLEPGLYIINGDEYVPVSYVSGKSEKTSTGILGFELGKKQYEYKGNTSNNIYTGQFLMVCDENRKNVKYAWGKYEPFVKSMTPDNMVIIPLEAAKKKRIYNEGTIIEGINVSTHERDPFTWEQLSDYVYLITTELQPGEYGIALKAAKLDEYNFSVIFDFTVIENHPVERIENAE